MWVLLDDGDEVKNKPTNQFPEQRILLSIDDPIGRRRYSNPFHHNTMRVLVLLVAPAFAFFPNSRNPSLTHRVRLSADVTNELEPKDMVKVFGRLAEKYIMLDDSGGMCCYSGCSGEKP